MKQLDLRQVTLSPSAATKILLAIVLAAMLVRIPLIFLKFPGFPVGWGGEMSSVAVALSNGEGFASPYWVPTGPTAHPPPVYPYLLSLMYRVTGVHTESSGMLALYINVVLSSLVCLPLFLIGKRLFNDTTGLAASSLWALYPLTGYSESLYIWNTSLYTLLLTTVVLAVLSIMAQHSYGYWVGLGVLFGVTVHVDTSSLLIAIFYLVYLYFQAGSHRWKVFIAAACLVLTLVPWLIRNYAVFDQPVFLRTNLGLEMYRGIKEDEFAAPITKIHLPNRDPAELERYQELGELAYMAEKMAIVKAYIVDDPGRYLLRSIRRALAYWFGNAHISRSYWLYGRFSVLKHIIFSVPVILGLYGLYVMRRTRVSGIMAFVPLFLIYPAVYYFATTKPRYRVPIEPVLFLLSAYTLIAAFSRWYQQSKQFQMQGSEELIGPARATAQIPER